MIGSFNVCIVGYKLFIDKIGVRGVFVFFKVFVIGFFKWKERVLKY